MMNRRDFLRWTGRCGVTALALSLPAGASCATPHAKVRPFEFEELGIFQLQELIDRGKASAVSLTRKYLARIKAIDQHGPRLNAVIELNPDALTIAAEVDRERVTKGRRGLLHGIPVLIKDNIDTHDRMTTTAGSLALNGSKPLRDAFVVERLRAAGAVLLGKTNLSECANF